MEYCSGGDIGKVIKRCKAEKDPISEDVIWRVLLQVNNALVACHNRKEGKIFHRDLKPSNIFLDKDHNVKLGDFGSAVKLKSHHETVPGESNVVGTTGSNKQPVEKYQ